MYTIVFNLDKSIQFMDGDRIANPENVLDALYSRASRLSKKTETTKILSTNGVGFEFMQKLEYVVE